MQFIENIQSMVPLEIFDRFITKFILSFILIFILWIIQHILSLIIRRHVSSGEKFYTIRKFPRYLVFVLGIFVIGQIWFTGIKSLGTFLGLFTAGLAIALKDVV